MKTQNESLNYAERWLSDGLKICEPPGFFVIIEVDMSRSQPLIERLRHNNIKATYTHLFVRATALVLARHRELHQIILGTKRFYPEQVDIGLSIAGKTFVAPTMVIERANCKTLKELSTEIMERTPEIRQEEMKMLAGLQKWGWLVPVGWLRRWILRFLLSQFWFRRRGVGTFQVSCLASVDVFVPFMFNTAAIVGVGRVCDRVVAVEGEPIVRPTVIISCCANHKVWDGVRAAKLLTELAKILESGELEEEVD